MPDERKAAAERTSTPDVAFAAWLAATLFGLFILVALTAGLVFHIATVALPKIVDERRRRRHLADGGGRHHDR